MANVFPISLEMVCSNLSHRACRFAQIQSYGSNLPILVALCRSRRDKSTPAQSAPVPVVEFARPVFSDPLPPTDRALEVSPNAHISYLDATNCPPPRSHRSAGHSDRH